MCHNAMQIFALRFLCICLHAQSMSTTLESFCNLFRMRSPCFMAAWYCAFFASGLQQFKTLSVSIS